MTFYVDSDPKCFFLHIPKTGGRSIRDWLSANTTGHKPHGSWHFDYAVNRNRMLRRYKVDLNDIITFAVIRNPWDRVVSGYHNFFPDNVISFEEFVYDKINLKAIRKPMSEYVGPKTITIEFDNLVEEFKQIPDMLKINYTPLPHVGKTKHMHYSEYYNEDTKKVIAEKYKVDIERFGYRFETKGT